MVNLDAPGRRLINSKTDTYPLHLQDLSPPTYLTLLQTTLLIINWAFVHLRDRQLETTSAESSVLQHPLPLTHGRIYSLH